MSATLTGTPPMVAMPQMAASTSAGLLLGRGQPVGVAASCASRNSSGSPATRFAWRSSNELVVGEIRPGTCAPATRKWWPQLRARPEVLLEHRLEQRLAAAVALGPQPLGHSGALGLRRLLDAGAFALEPGHGARVSSGCAVPGGGIVARRRELPAPPAGAAGRGPMLCPIQYPTNAVATRARCDVMRLWPGGSRVRAGRVGCGDMGEPTDARVRGPKSAIRPGRPSGLAARARRQAERAARAARAAERVRVAGKHDGLVRLSHWAHVPLLFGLIVTGLAIYWAAPVFHHAPTPGNPRRRLTSWTSAGARGSCVRRRRDPLTGSTNA